MINQWRLTAQNTFFFFYSWLKIELKTLLDWYYIPPTGVHIYFSWQVRQQKVNDSFAAFSSYKAHNHWQCLLPARYTGHDYTFLIQLIFNLNATSCALEVL